MIFRINGTETLHTLVPGMNELTFPGPEEIAVEIVAAPQGCAAVFDARRDYGRSTLDGKTLRGEWVMRFTF